MIGTVFLAFVIAVLLLLGADMLMSFGDNND